MHSLQNSYRCKRNHRTCDRYVVDTWVCIMPGLTKGVGFIRFNLKSEAEAAIKLRSGTVPPGATEPITVKFANQPTISKVPAPPLQPVSATAVNTDLKYVAQFHQHQQQGFSLCMQFYAKYAVEDGLCRCWIKFVQLKCWFRPTESWFSTP